MAPTEALPKNWPQGVPYLRAPLYAPSITPSHKVILQTHQKGMLSVPSNLRGGPCTLVKITKITSPSHPAAGQCGLFAARDLKPGTFILQYIGEVHATASSPENDPHAESDYDLSLDREHSIGIDAGPRGNEARFVNDYRGISEKPNAEFQEIWDEKRKERGMAVWVLPQGKSGKGNGIKKGEELLVSYGRGFWGARKTEGGD